LIQGFATFKQKSTVTIRNTAPSLATLQTSADFTVFKIAIYIPWLELSILLRSSSNFPWEFAIFEA